MLMKKKVLICVAALGGLLIIAAVISLFVTVLTADVNQCAIGIIGGAERPAEGLTGMLIWQVAWLGLPSYLFYFGVFVLVATGVFALATAKRK